MGNISNIFRLYGIYIILGIALLGTMVLLSENGNLSTVSFADQISSSGGDDISSPTISSDKPEKTRRSGSDDSGDSSVFSDTTVEGAPACLNGMVSYWKLNETSGLTAVDSADGNNGDVYWASMGQPGMSGYSYYFDNDNPHYGSPTASDINPSYVPPKYDYIHVNNPAANLNFSGSKNFTIAFWVKPHGDNDDNVILGRGTDWYYFKLEDCGFMCGEKLYFTYVEKKYGNPNPISAVSNSDLDEDKWYFVVGVKNGNKIYLYINGIKQIDDGTISNQVYQTSDAFEMGRNSDNNGNYFEGNLDEVVVFNMSLSQDDITELYTRSRFGNDYCTPFVDTVAPTISIQSPDSILYPQVPGLRYTVSDNVAVSNCWYTLNDDDEMHALDDCMNLSISPGDPEILNNLTVYVNDTSGYQSNASVSFIFDNCPDVSNPGQEDDEGDGIGNACEPIVTCNPSLVSHWKLDEDPDSIRPDSLEPEISGIALDSADSNNGTAYGTDMGQIGRVNHSYKFYRQYIYDNEDAAASDYDPNHHPPPIPTYDYIHVQNPADNLNFSSNEDFTIAAWVKLKGDNDNNIILGRGTDWYYFKLKDCGFMCGEKLYFTYVEERSYRPGSEVLHIPPPPPYEEISGVSDSTLAQDTWYFITGVKNGTHVSLYINGIKQSYSEAHSNAPAYRTSDAFEMGRNSDNNGDYFEGWLDEVAVYNSALDQGNITEMYTRSLVGKPYCNAPSDNVPPTITIESPTEQFYPRLTHRVNVNYTVNETNLDSCWYDLTRNGNLINESVLLEGGCQYILSVLERDGLEDGLLCPCTNLSSLQVGYGHFCLTIYANDTFGNIGNSTVCFTTAGKADEASEAEEELLPLSAFLDSIRCSSDGTGDVTIEVWDYKDDPLGGVLVEISGQSDTTGSNGRATLNDFDAGEYTASISREGYQSATLTFTVSCPKREISQPPSGGAGEGVLGVLSVIVEEMTYNNDGTADVHILVEDSFGNPISGAIVTVSGDDILYITSDDGTAVVRNIPTGDYTLTASKKGYNQDEVDFTIRFQAKSEPAQVSEQPAIEEQGTTIPFYMNIALCAPIVLVLIVLGILYFLWKRGVKGAPAKPK